MEKKKKNSASFEDSKFKSFFENKYCLIFCQECMAVRTSWSGPKEMNWSHGLIFVIILTENVEQPSGWRQTGSAICQCWWGGELPRGANHHCHLQSDRWQWVVHPVWSNHHQTNSSQSYQPCLLQSCWTCKWKLRSFCWTYKFLLTFILPPFPSRIRSRFFFFLYSERPLVSRHLQNSSLTCQVGLGGK